jgi:hypothetical protein
VHREGLHRFGPTGIIFFELYEATAPGDSMRRLLSDIAAAHFGPESLTEDFSPSKYAHERQSLRDAIGEFFYDLALALMKNASYELKITASNYHQPVEGEQQDDSDADDDEESNEDSDEEDSDDDDD